MGTLKNLPQRFLNWLNPSVTATVEEGQAVLNWPSWVSPFIWIAHYIFHQQVYLVAKVIDPEIPIPLSKLFIVPDRFAAIQEWGLQYPWATRNGQPNEAWVVDLDDSVFWQPMHRMVVFLFPDNRPIQAYDVAEHAP